MGFFNKLKSNILGSVKEDLNSALGGKQQLFNSKISGALDDLIAMKTGIQISNIPTKITEEATQAAEFRKKMAKEAQEGGEADTGSSMYSPPRSEQTLRFPTDDQRFVDNWIVFRTLDRRIDAQHITGTVKDGEKDGAAAINARMASAGFVKPNDMVAQRNAKKTFEAYSGHKWNEGYTIALYFPNSVKDVISVEYETKEVGIGDTIINSLFGKGRFDESIAVNSLHAMGDGFKEAWKNAANNMISFRPLQEGVVGNMPKFNLFQGVSLRDHTYTFNLNPYNIEDAQEITKIVQTLKMLSLPTSSAFNPRLKILPAEFEINFKGPILGNIEHPQTCFLSTVDVDYSGGKDMSFIEDINVPQPNDPNLGNADKAGNITHYPNGITLTLTFKEILQLDRHRYNARVAPDAMGAAQLDTIEDMINIEAGRADDEGFNKTNEEISIGDGSDIEFNEFQSYRKVGQVHSTEAKAKEALVQMKDHHKYEIVLKQTTGAQFSKVNNYVIKLREGQ